MKLILTYSLVAAAAMCAFTACNDKLDEIVYSELTDDNAFTTADDALAAVNSIYQPLIDVTNRDIFYLNDMATDDCYRANMDCEILNDAKLNENQDVMWSWDGYYTMIGHANTALAKIPAIEMDEDLKTRYLAEAHFLRGFAYYQLTDIFFRVPLITEPVEDQMSKSPLASIGDLETQIKTDLETAAAGLPTKYESKNDAGRATIGAAYGMLARLYMRQAGRMRLEKKEDPTELWQSALSYLHKVMDLGNEGVYSLQDHVWDIYDPDREECKYNNELIFAVHSNPNSGFGTSDIGMNFTPWEYDMGWNLFSLPLSLVWKMNPADERYSKLMITEYANVYGENKYYIIPASIYRVGTVYREDPDGRIVYELEAGYTKKYKYQKTGTYNYNTGNDMPILRYADILLSRAEVLNELGEIEAAVTTLNWVRQRGFASTAYNLKASDYASVDELREAICDERLYELNNEGVRRPDLIRMGLWKDRLDKYIANIKAMAEMKEKNAAEQADKTDPEHAPHTMDYSDLWKVYPDDLTENDKRRYYPIPKRETDLNPELANNREF